MFGEARDDAGVLAAQVSGASPLRLQLDRAPVGEVRLKYVVLGRARAPSEPIAVDVDPNRAVANGEALLMLPDAFEDRAIPVALKLATRPFSDGAGAASSFGVGADREIVATGASLRAATFLIGPMGRALFDTQEGHDEAAWLGYTSFDPRPISADVAAFRTAVRELFHDDSRAPLTLLIVADARPPGAFVASRRSSSVLVRVGVGEPWTGAVRIAVAAEVIHGWIGSRLWIGPDDRDHEAEAYWFTEGVTRQLARDLLFRFGLISPAELLDELHGLASVLATSPHRGLGNAELAARAGAAGVVPLLVARGALYAAGVEARIRKKSGGKRGVGEVLRGLYQKAREARGPLPVGAWLSAVSAESGADEGKVFGEAIERGRVGALPEGALGPCFQAKERKYEVFGVGFDWDGSQPAAPRPIVGLKAGGPAAKAGVRAGDLLAEAQITRGRADVPVVLSIERAGVKTKIRYRPVAALVSGPGWIRKRDVGDEACAR